MKKIKVMFVCMGNICRSPTAHAVFRDLVEKSNLSDRIEVASSGTHAYHIGEKADTRSASLVKSKGIRIDDLRAQKIVPQDLFEYDYILTMDRDNTTIVKSMATVDQADKIQLFLEYAGDTWRTREVPDPYFGGNDGFNRVYDMIQDASLGLLKSIKKSYNLE